MSASLQDTNYAFVDVGGFVHYIDDKDIAVKSAVGAGGKIVETEQRILGGYPVWEPAAGHIMEALVNVDKKTVKVSETGDGEGWRNLREGESVPVEIMRVAQELGF